MTKRMFYGSYCPLTPFLAGPAIVKALCPYTTSVDRNPAAFKNTVLCVETVRKLMTSIYMYQSMMGII